MANRLRSENHGPRDPSRRIGPAEADEVVLNEIRAIRAGGGFGSIIGRNSFQRKKGEALWLLESIMKIYGGEMA